MMRVSRFGLGVCRIHPHIPARISHRWSTVSPQTSVLAALRSVGLLDVLHEYDCGGSPRVVSGASLARTALATPRYDKRREIRASKQKDRLIGLELQTPSPKLLEG